MTYSLEITTRIGCANDCSFCPQSDLRKAYKSDKRVLTLDDFKTILAKVPKHVRIDFSGFAEPFFNKDAPEMILHAKSEGFSVHLYSTLMGLSEEGCLKLKDAGIDYIRLHVPDVKGMVLDCETWIRQHQIFHALGLHYTAMSMGDQTEAVKSHLESLGVPVERPDMLSRGGLLWDSRKLSGRIICGMDRWHQNVLLPDGTVVLDCHDYGLTCVLGNLATGDYAAIDAEASKWREASNPPAICFKCEWARPA